MIKLGGSLLDLEDLTDRLLGVIRDIPLPLILTGGGPLADSVRQWDSNGLVTDREAHQLAIAAMSFNATSLARRDHRFSVVASHKEALDRGRQGQIPLLDAMEVLAAEEGRRLDLPVIPRSWDVTSDAIAAWLARAWGAELWLLKSVDPIDVERDVDRWFFKAAAGLSEFCWVNLRSAAPIPVSVPLASRLLSEDA